MRIRYPQAKIFLWIIFLIASIGTLSGADKTKKPRQPVNYKANLALVPAKDPKPKQVITVVKTMANQHPRLLFTPKEIEEMQALASKDPLAKELIDDTIKIAGMYPFGKGRPDFVLEDTPAIWKAGGTYPGLAYAYHFSHKKEIKDKIIAILTKMLDEPYWSDTQELDSSMGAGNNMMMVGILFDAIYNDLEPEFRSKMAEKILVHVRRMWYLGHQKLAVKTVKYWQNDPQNNHRWHRNGGIAACLLAIADEPNVDTAYMLEQFKGEMDYILKWLPEDGDCHEGAGYQGFGFMYLALASRMMDRVLGTNYQEAPGLRTAWKQQIYWWAPGRSGDMSFGDDSNGKGGGFDRTDGAFFIGPQLSGDKLAQAALLFHMDVKRKVKDDLLPWTLLPFYDAKLSGGDHLDLPTQHLLVDLGAASMRDTWKPDAVAVTFKCGPYGGYKLNDFAWSTGKLTYINVAHDDPDANSFALGMDGDFIFHPGSYSMPKKTESNSTLLVDGKGQVNEGAGYTQPVKGKDMRTLAYLTAWKQGESNRLVVEGEAGPSYEGKLERFRRTLIWMPGDYVLLLDDIIGNGEHNLDWIGATTKGKITDASTGRGTATGGAGKSVAFQVVASEAIQGEVKPYTMAARFGDVKLEQICFSAKAKAIRYACVLDPWGRQAKVSLSTEKDLSTVTVTLGAKSDTWSWIPAKDAKSPSTIEGKRDGKVLIALSSQDKAPEVK